MTQAQLLKIKSQVEQQQNQSRGASSAVDSSVSVLREEQERKITHRSANLVDLPRYRVFGKDISSQEDLTFAPTRNIPTLVNYKLGAGYEVASVNIHYFILHGQTPDGITLSDGDNISIRQGLECYENRARIQGSILFPGYYEMGDDVNAVGGLTDKSMHQVPV